MRNLEDVGQFGKWTFNIPPGPLHMELQLQTNNRIDVVWVGDTVPDISVKIMFHDGCLICVTCAIYCSNDSYHMCHMCFILFLFALVVTC